MIGDSSSEVSCCCCVSGKVHAKFQISKRGFVPGEPIYITAEVHNGSNSDCVQGSFVSLKQVKTKTWQKYLWINFIKCELHEI